MVLFEAFSMANLLDFFDNKIKNYLEDALPALLFFS